MKWASHKIIGIITAYSLGLPVIPAFIASTLPDIDIYFKRKNGGLLFSHRGITHHLVLCVVLIVFAIYTQNIWIKSFLAGYVSHIFADILTVSGVPYWTSKDRFSLKLFKTGSIQEAVFVVSLMFTVFLLFFYKGFYIPVEIQILLQGVGYGS